MDFKNNWNITNRREMGSKMTENLGKTFQGWQIVLRSFRVDSSIWYSREMASPANLQCIFSKNLNVLSK